jgi:hypothetical protein
MVNWLLSAWLRRLGGTPCFRIHGKSRRESAWRIIDVFATHRRDSDSRWFAPFWRGTCITWTAEVIAIGWDFAERVLREQAADPASRERPVEVAGGRIRDWQRRTAAGASSQVSASEVLAHECGHTRQVLRYGVAYWPIGGSLTLFREGPHWWNYFENQASEEGQFGGIVNGSVCGPLMERLQERLAERKA